MIIPPIMPRPDLMPLTGGYRKTPVMQIGADVYCDTQCILRELERRFPDPTLYPGASEGVCWATTMLADRPFFQASVAVIFGNLKPSDLQPGFVEDREKLSGGRFDFEAMAARGPYAKDQWHPRGLDRAPARRRPAVPASAPQHGWGTSRCSSRCGSSKTPIAAPRCCSPGSRSCGPGARAFAPSATASSTDMTSAEALAVGTKALPTTAVHADPADPNGLKPGDRVGVAPDDYGRVPVAGDVVSSSAQHVAIRRRDPVAGEVVVHFPRAGFVVAKAEQAEA